jgi:hypothetical protein
MTKTGERLADIASSLGLNLPAEAQEALPLPLRGLHRAVLRAFPETGTAPSEAWIRNLAVGLDLDPDAALARLAHDDLVHTANGIVTVAYPYSGTPTAHRVLLDGGPPVWAMCAVDALGIPLITGRDGVIFSVDPDGGEPIRVERRGGAWSWESGSAVLLVAMSGCVSAAGACCPNAAEACCPFVNFHSSAERAEAHLSAHPDLAGQVVDQAAAVELAAIVFGSLLRR